MKTLSKMVRRRRVRENGFPAAQSPAPQPPQQSPPQGQQNPAGDQLVGKTVTLTQDLKTAGGVTHKSGTQYVVLQSSPGPQGAVLTLGDPQSKVAMLKGVMQNEVNQGTGQPPAAGTAPQAAPSSQTPQQNPPSQPPKSSQPPQAQPPEQKDDAGEEEDTNDKKPPFMKKSEEDMKDQKTETVRLSRQSIPVIETIRRACIYLRKAGLKEGTRKWHAALRGYLLSSKRIHETKDMHAASRNELTGFHVKDYSDGNPPTIGELTVDGIPSMVIAGANTLQILVGDKGEAWELGKVGLSHKSAWDFIEKIPDHIDRGKLYRLGFKKISERTKNQKHGSRVQEIAMRQASKSDLHGIQGAVPWDDGTPPLVGELAVDGKDATIVADKNKVEIYTDDRHVYRLGKHIAGLTANTAKGYLQKVPKDTTRAKLEDLGFRWRQ